MTLRGALVGAVTAATPAAASADPYVALGDSVAAGGSTYVAQRSSGHIRAGS